jgi:signal transduction histidine kinase
LIYLALVLAIFSIRRYLELRTETRSRRKAERHKDEFLNMVTHELRTPLTTIREGVSQISDGILGPTTKSQQEFLTIVLDDIDRLTRLINNILDLSSLEANRVTLRAEHLDMAKVVDHVASLFEPEARRKGLKLGVSLSVGPLEVYTDADKLLQIWSNLVRNALKFTNEGTVLLEAHEHGDYVECLVKDTGIGIKPEDRSRIFMKFFQAVRSQEPGEKGAGLGLPIAKALVEAQGGEIFVSSKVGVGSTFGFRLPKAPV